MSRVAGILPRLRNLRVQLVLVIVPLVLYLAARLGQAPSLRRLVPFVALPAALVLVRQPVLGLFALVAAALFFPVEFGTGTQVSLNASVLMVAALAVVCLLDMVRRRDVRFVPSVVSRPLLLFVVSSMLSLIAGNALWSPAVPRPANILAVQLGQWAIFALAAGAFLLTTKLIREERWLYRLVFFFLVAGGVIALLRVLPEVGALVGGLATMAIDRAPFWACLVALAGGQWVFNQRLGNHARWAMVTILAVGLYYSLVIMRESISTWAPSLLALGVLIWLRFPRLRWPAVVLGAFVLVFSYSAIFEFAGGEAEWTLSGGSRMALIRRVVEVTMHNPILGLGPASYRAYAAMEPLAYRNAFWVLPEVNSHNNYVDLFAHTGLLGLGLFLWFLIELGRLGWRLSLRYREGFLGGYVNGMLAAYVALLVAMMLADWLLPHVYNIGFPGFQASVLAWMFLGGLVAVENMTEGEPGCGE